MVLSEIRSHCASVFAIVLVTLTTLGCASVSPLESANQKFLVNCEVTVWASRQSALEKGRFKELCLITGTSAMSFSHTVATAIEKHKSKACACGATNVYIQHQDPGTLGTASVSLVAFEFEK